MFKQVNKKTLFSYIVFFVVCWRGLAVTGSSQPQVRSFDPQARRAAELVRLLDDLQIRDTGSPELMQDSIFQRVCTEAGVTGTLEERLAQLREKAELFRQNSHQGLAEPLTQPQTPVRYTEIFYQQLPEIVVTNTKDSGAGSLRQAILDAEAAGGFRRIVFHLEQSDDNFDRSSGTWRIKLLTKFVIKSSGIMVDGLSQAQYGGDTNPNGPEVVLDARGFKTGQFDEVDGRLIADGFLFTIFGGDNNVVRGFVFDTVRVGNFSPGAFLIAGRVGNPSMGNMFLNNYVGIASDGETLITGGENQGILIFSNGQNTRIENNVISVSISCVTIFGNASFPDLDENSVQNLVRNNFFNTNKTGTRRIAPVSRIGSNGLPQLNINLQDGPRDTLVEGNIIGGTRVGGIGQINKQGTLALSYSLIKNNRIGIGLNNENIAPDPNQFIPGPPGSTDPGDQGKYAIGVLATPGDIVESNLIANFALAGVIMRNLNGSPAMPVGQIQGNTISNCGMGMQLGQMTQGARVTGNTITDCPLAGIVVAEDMFDAALIYGTAYVPRPVPNPTGLPSINISIENNNFARITGPGIGLTHNIQTIIGGTYIPNTATEVINGFGPNGYQPTPVIMSANRANDGSVMVTGRTVGAGTLELSLSERPPRPGAPDTDVTAYGMGFPIGSFAVQGGLFQVQIPNTARAAASLTATVTVNGQTSEFARTVAVQASQPPLDTIPPIVQVTAPTVGQQIESKAGTQVSIVWQSSDNVGVVRHDVWLARPGPGAVEVIASGLTGTAQTFTWNVPENLDVPQAQIVVMAFDAARNQGQGVSGMFTVKKPVVVPPDTEKPVVTTVTLSKKKVNRKVDPTVTISWKSTDNQGVTAQDVLYAMDGTNFGLTVAAGLPGNAQSFVWTVPNTLAKSKVGVVKIVAHDGAGNTGEAVSNFFVVK